MIIDIFAWQAEAAPGASVVYYRGALVSPADRLPGVERWAQRRALACACRGLVDLVQRRHGAFDYEYIAIKRAAPPKWPPLWYTEHDHGSTNPELGSAREIAKALSGPTLLERVA